MDSYLSGQLNEIVLIMIFLPTFISVTWFITRDMLVSGLPSVSKQKPTESGASAAYWYWENANYKINTCP